MTNQQRLADTKEEIKEGDVSQEHQDQLADPYDETLNQVQNELGERKRDQKFLNKSHEESKHFSMLTRQPEDHFDNTIHKRDSFEQRKVGRPFKGQVEEFTKEPNVPERRSILRGFKKFFSRKEFEDIKSYINKLEWNID